MEAEIFSFPRWKRDKPGWSYRFDMRDTGPAVVVAYGGENIAEFEVPWEEAIWSIPAFWPMLMWCKGAELLVR